MGAISSVNSYLCTSMTCFTVMLTMSAKARIEALMVALATNGAAPPSGSGSKPKLVLPGVYVSDIIADLVLIR